MPRPIVWLHLSDLHACDPRSGWDAKRVLDTLRNDLVHMAQEQGLRPDLIFFTGDAAFGHLSHQKGEAISDQFQAAEEFLTAVRESFEPEVPKRNLYLVPGNHDVNRTRIAPFETDWLSKPHSLDEIQHLIHKGGLPWERVFDRLSDYAHFLRTYDYEHLLTKPELLIYADVRELDGCRVGISGFNSAWSSRGAGREEKAGLWMAGRYQLETLRAEAPPNDFAIALLHHPGNWLVPEENPSFFRELERDYAFVLHGHEHQEFVRSEASTGHTVLSAGACHEYSQGKNNGYNFVRLDLEQGRGEVWLREYDSVGAQWRARVVPGKTDERGRWPLEHLTPWIKKLHDRGTPATHVEHVEGEPNKKGETHATALDYESRYRKAVAQRLDYVELFGIDIPKESEELSLSISYVSLGLRREHAGPIFIEYEDEAEEEDSRDHDAAQETSLPAEELFEKLSGEERRILILGPAGCGKTTLLRWAAVQSGHHRKDTRTGH